MIENICKLRCFSHIRVSSEEDRPVKVSSTRLVKSYLQLIHINSSYFFTLAATFCEKTYSYSIRCVWSWSASISFESRTDFTSETRTGFIQWNLGNHGDLIEVYPSHIDFQHSVFYFAFIGLKHYWIGGLRSAETIFQGYGMCGKVPVVLVEMDVTWVDRPGGKKLAQCDS